MILLDHYSEHRIKITWGGGGAKVEEEKFILVIVEKLTLKHSSNFYEINWEVTENYKLSNTLCETNTIT